MCMCGRTRLSTDYSETRIKLKFDPDCPAPNIPASWNVCPTDPMLVAVRSQDGKRIPQQMRWGLVPWWAKDIKVGFSSINARAETVDTTRAFRDAWKDGQRCTLTTWPVNRQRIGNVRNKGREVAEPEPLEALSGS
jgi:putative SOS response-associated peptidase YedK